MPGDKLSSLDYKDLFRFYLNKYVLCLPVRYLYIISGHIKETCFASTLVNVLFMKGGLYVDGYSSIKQENNEIIRTAFDKINIAGI